MESREDIYLLEPQLARLSVKVRGVRAAALVFAQALPAGVQPGPDQSRSYAQWLSQRPGADSDASA
jgi:hypothetical protein